MADPCTVVKLRVADLDNAAKDPALAALLGDGWREVASVVVAPAGGGEPMLHLVLAPPREAGGGAPAPWAWGPYVAIALLVVQATQAVLVAYAVGWLSWAR